MKNDQFAVYRVDRNSEGRDLWHLSYQEAVSRKLAIRIEHYRQMDIRPLLPGENAIALWKRMKESCEVSDVIVLNQNGEIHCYYVNEDYPQLLSGFIRLNPSGTLVTLDTENYRISGKPGNWMATDDIIIDGKQFYLMEHQEYHRQVAYIILDSYGKMIMEECQNGFDEKTKQKLHELMKVPEQRKQEHQKYKNRLEHYQKFFENGTYERSWESGIEGNYNMVDGQVNNLKMMINYGMDKMKFGQAVLSGQSIRLVTTLHSLTNLRGVAKAEIKFAIEIKDQPKKALEGIAVFLYYFN